MKKITLMSCMLLGISAMNMAAAWSYGPYPQVFQQWHSGPQISTGFQIQQYATPDGYHIRISSRGDASHVNITVEGRRITLSSRQMHERREYDGGGRIRMMTSGDFSQWILLPGDADMRSMRRREQPGLIDIFVPRLR